MVVVWCGNHILKTQALHVNVYVGKQQRQEAIDKGMVRPSTCIDVGE